MSEAEQSTVQAIESIQSRVYCFVDGFNLYHALDWFEDESYHPDNRKYRKYKWISLSALAKCYISPKSETLEGVEYFTTYAHWDEGKIFRHKRFVLAQIAQGVKPTFGKFKNKQVECKSACKQKFSIWAEKQTDVNIAVKLVELGRQDVYDKALIISGDSDLIPAIKLIRSLYPEKKISAVVPIGRKGEEIIAACGSSFKMTEDHLKRSLMDETMPAAGGVYVTRPPTWI